MTRAVIATIGAAVAMAATGLATTGLFAWSGAYSVDYLTSNYLPYYLLMGWSEAMLTGMYLTSDVLDYIDATTHNDDLHQEVWIGIEGIVDFDWHDRRVFESLGGHLSEFFLQRLWEALIFSIP